LSLVTFPAKTSAFVENIKSIQEAKDIREIESALRESGHTKSEAQQIISVIKKSLRDSEAQKKEEKALRDSEQKEIAMGSILDSLKSINT